MMKQKLISLLMVGIIVLGLNGQALATETTDGAYSGLLRTKEGILATDVYNKVVWIMTEEGKTIYAGKISSLDLAGIPKEGYYDSTLAESLFASPWAIAPFLEGYAVTDPGNNVVRYVSKSGVRTLAGTQQAGLRNSLGNNARFDYPTGLAADNGGNLYVSDTGNNVIRKISKSGQVTTFATGFLEPTGLFYLGGALYVADSGHHRVCKVVNGTVTVLAGSVEGQTTSEGVYEGDYVDGNVTHARFSNPQGVAVAADGTVYVADTGNGAVRKIYGERVSTLLAPAKGAEETFPVSPRGLLLEGDSLYVSDVFARQIKEISLSGQMPSFPDVASDSWYAQAVAYAASTGVLTGTDRGFEPEGIMSRAMAAVFISRLYNNSHPAQILTGERIYVDVTPGDWFYDAVAWVADQDITGGTGVGFAPKQAVTRQELACFLYRYAAFLGMDTETGLGAGNALSAFPDATQVSSWAREAMAWAVENEIFSGDNNGALNPLGIVTRAQAAQIVKNLMPMLP